MTAPPAAATAAAQPLIGHGVVRHRRLLPRGHAFTYPNYFLLLPMRSLRAAPSAALPRNRFGLLSFHDRDHGDGSADALHWLDTLLAGEGITDAQGEVWLQAYPRVLGYAFKPVSFWYCERTDGTLAAIVAEVNNTFGERHCYLLAGSADAPLAYGHELEARKVFHVSPFCQLQGRYRFRFMRTAQRLVARVEHDGDDGLPLLQTSSSGHLQPLTASSLRRAFWAMPLMTLGVVLRIHWQALQLWCKRIPFVPKPAAPQAFVSR